MLQKLRNLWVALANQRDLMTEADVATEIEAINQMHMQLSPSAERIRG
jgi:hypothetical protein